MCTLKGISLACCARILRVCARKGQRQQGGRRGLPQSPWCSRRTYCSSHCVSAKTWSMHSSIKLMVRAFNLCHWNPPGNRVRHGGRARLRVLDLAKRVRPQPCPHPAPTIPPTIPAGIPALIPVLIPSPPPSFLIPALFARRALSRVVRCTSSTISRHTRAVTAPCG